MVGVLGLVIEPLLPLRPLLGEWRVEERSFGLDGRPTDVRQLKVYVRRTAGSTRLLLSTSGASPEDSLVIAADGSRFLAWSYIEGIPKPIEWAGEANAGRFNLSAQVDGLPLRTVFAFEGDRVRWTSETELAGTWSVVTERVLSPIRH